MMRNKPSSSMQKTYDDCYLQCSTAVYFESQNNESEALRSWRDALDAIYYHNAYKIPSGWRPRTETDKALQESLRQMELRCKERVDLLEALRESREDKKKSSTTDVSKVATAGNGSTTVSAAPGLGAGVVTSTDPPTPGWLGNGTVPPSDYASIPRPSQPQAPPLPARSVQSRPAFTTRKSSGRDAPKIKSSSKPTSNSPYLLSTGTLAPQRPDAMRRSSRTPSPEKKGMLRTLRSGKDRRDSSGKMASSLRSKPPAAAKAATQAWGTIPYGSSEVNLAVSAGEGRSSLSRGTGPAMQRNYSDDAIGQARNLGRSSSGHRTGERTSLDSPLRPNGVRHQSSSGSMGSISSLSHGEEASAKTPVISIESPTSTSKPALSMPAYRQEYPPTQPSKYNKPPLATPPRQWDHRTSSAPANNANPSSPTQTRPTASHTVPRKAVGVVSAIQQRRQLDDSFDDAATSLEHAKTAPATTPKQRKARPTRSSAATDPVRPSTSSSNDSPTESSSLSPNQPWETRKQAILSHLPANIDRQAATQILNEVALSTQPVHWTDISGLATAKAALKENVIYPFLRPDLFRGLRSPANGILLFGPPGTGKTMLARAVATESRSTFFAIGAGSLTSKFLGESEKLVRALFACARLAGPSIVFVDEIESLLGRRGEGAHDAVERVKTEFLVGWGELQAAVAASEREGGAGRDEGMGDPSRVLVLAATNLPWLIDEAARRRFVRRQYIPLPEGGTRGEQLAKLLEKQRHALGEKDLDDLVRLTDGFSGSDITSLAKDAAMGPLRALGEKLLDMSPDEIRPIMMEDFRASLVNIRPSVSKAGLAEFEKWAAEFGERGG